MGCGHRDDAGSGTGAGTGQGALGAELAPQQVHNIEQRILNTRARALHDHNPRLFLRRVDHSDKALVARQTQLFRNLVQLPLTTFSTRVLAGHWPVRSVEPVAKSQRAGGRLDVPRLDRVMQLATYDAEPVHQTTGLVFSFHGTRATIVGDRAKDGRPLVVGQPQPWELVPIKALREGNVLGVFEASTWPSAREVVDAVRNGISVDAAVVPYDWNQNVVVYSFSNPQVLEAFNGVPGGNIEHLGAMTFPVRERAGTTAPLASSRFVVLPSSVQAGPAFLARICRHELTHVAVGVHDDGIPTWVSEGVAEWLAARPLPVGRRVIPTVALSRAQGVVDALPGSSTFNDSDQDWHYALSWMAVEYLAQARGEAVVWQLVDALHAGGKGTPDDEQDAILRQVTGMGAAEIAAGATDRIRRRYG